MFTFPDASTDVKEDLLDHAEKYMTVKMYTSLFCPPTTDDEQKDLQMQTQIRSLHWVSAQQLDTLINEHIPEIRALIDQAITGINKSSINELKYLFGYKTRLASSRYLN